MRMEQIILKNLLKNEDYSRKVLPFLKEDYFKVIEDKNIFSKIKDFILKFNTLPNKTILTSELDKITSLKETQVKTIKEIVDEIYTNKDVETIDWLIERTEEFCQENAIYNAMTEAIEIMNGESKTKAKGEIPKILSDALAITFDPNIGHEYLTQSDKRFDHYHRVEERLPFDLEKFNVITKGGIPNKTFNVILGGVGKGKTLVMCHLASCYLLQGYDVLYITLEMAEEEISKRIDANLLNISLDDLVALPKEIFDKKIQSLKAKTGGRLIVKEYPTATASVIHFNSLMNELYLKKNFKPVVVFVDYINLCASSRIKSGGQINSYLFIKSIAEELRGFAVEHGIRLWTATQVNRVGFTSSDPGMENTADSFGLPATADFMFSIISNDQLDQLNQLMIKQLKNRYNEIVTNKRFVIGIDRSKMKLYDVDDKAQTGITQDSLTPTTNRDKFSELEI